MKITKAPQRNDLVDVYVLEELNRIKICDILL